SCRHGVELWSVMGDPGDGFARWMANGGDYDGDGVDDVAVSAPGAASGGEVRFISGVDGSLLGVLDGDWASAAVRNRVGPGFAADGDGDPDIASVHYEPAGLFLLSLYDERSQQKLAEICSSGGGFGDFQGFSVAGDLDHDGFTDLIVGLPYENS